MKHIPKFLRTTLGGGILFLMAIVVLVIVLGSALVLADKVVGPLAEHIPVASVIGLRTSLLLAIGVITSNQELNVIPPKGILPVADAALKEARTTGE